MAGIGILLIILGFGSLILRSFDYQFRLLSWAEDMQPGFGIVVGIIGILLLVAAIVLGRRKAAGAAQAGGWPAEGQAFPPPGSAAPGGPSQAHPSGQLQQPPAGYGQAPTSGQFQQPGHPPEHGAAQPPGPGSSQHRPQQVPPQFGQQAEQPGERSGSDRPQHG